jgi:hypothetical protein
METEVMDLKTECRIATLTTRIYWNLKEAIRFDLFSFFGWSWTDSTITEATTGLLYQPRMMNDDECGAIGVMLGMGNRSTQRRPAPVQFCPPQIPHELAPRPSRWEVATNRLSYVTAQIRCYRNLRQHFSFNVGYRGYQIRAPQSVNTDRLN